MVQTMSDHNAKNKIRNNHLKNTKTSQLVEIFKKKNRKEGRKERERGRMNTCLRNSCVKDKIKTTIVDYLDINYSGTYMKT